ncbi:hypothetical protein [Deinococcus sp.]|nr:hypothetical protein [Deinococcus sp.]
MTTRRSHTAELKRDAVQLARISVTAAAATRRNNQNKAFQTWSAVAAGAI